MADWPYPRQLTRTLGAFNAEGQKLAIKSFRRGGRQPAEQVLVELEPMISALINENRELHRQIDKLSKQTLDTASGGVERALRAMQRRVSGTLDGEIEADGRRSSSATSRSRVRRKVTDPQLLERRRQALAKAREARAAKWASAESLGFPN